MDIATDSPSLVLDQLVWIERHYVGALNAILAAPNDGDDSDVDRWRGHAEAYRTISTDLRRRFGLPAANLCSQEWRDAHGVYTKEQISAFRRA